MNKINLLLILFLILLNSCNKGKNTNVENTNNSDETIIALTNKWNESIDKQDIQTLTTLYADQVSHYGSSISKAKVLDAKKSFFKNTSIFKQWISGEIIVTETTDGLFKSQFTKHSEINHKSSAVSWYLLFKKVNDKYLITTESDELTDKNLAKPKKAKVLIGEVIEGDFDGDNESKKYHSMSLKQVNLTKNLLN